MKGFSNQADERVHLYQLVSLHSTEISNHWLDRMGNFTISYPFKWAALSNSWDFCTYIKLFHTADKLKGHQHRAMVFGFLLTHQASDPSQNH